MNKLKKEFIGLEVEIQESRNKTLEGLKGCIIDETKNTFRIKTSDDVKTVMKNTSVFMIGKDRICGDKIVKRPHERIKLKVKNER